MATIIEMITAIVMLTPEDANLLKTTHLGILSFRLIYNSTFTDRLTSFWQFFQLAISGNWN